MGLLQRLQRLISSKLSDTFDSRSIEDIINASDDELKKIINDLRNEFIDEDQKTSAQRPESTSQSQKQTTSSSSQQQYSRRNQHTSQNKYQSTVTQAYTTLGLLPTATIEDIKSAYRTLIRKYHPDKVAVASQREQDIAKRRSQDINNAYQILKKIRRIP